MRKVITAIILAILVVFIAPVYPAYAQSSSSCQILFGGGQACQEEVSFVLDKFVQIPKSNNFTNKNLTENDPKFEPSDTVNFKITIKNTGIKDIANLEVMDVFPDFINFSEGPGQFDSSSKTLTVNVDKITVNQTKTIDIKAKIANNSSLPQDKSFACVTNSSNAQTQDGFSAQSQIQFCITHNMLNANLTPPPTATPPPTVTVMSTITPSSPSATVMPISSVKTIPATGPEMLPLIGLAGSGITGAIIKRKSR